MLHTVDGLGGTDTVGVVGVGIAIEGFQLPTLFPCQSVAQITGGAFVLSILPPAPNVNFKKNSRTPKGTAVVGATTG